MSTHAACLRDNINVCQNSLQVAVDKLAKMVEVLRNSQADAVKSRDVNLPGDQSTRELAYPGVNLPGKLTLYICVGELGSHRPVRHQHTH